MSIGVQSKNFFQEDVTFSGKLGTVKNYLNAHHDVSKPLAFNHNEVAHKAWFNKKVSAFNVQVGSEFCRSSQLKKIGVVYRADGDFSLMTDNKPVKELTHEQNEILTKLFEEVIMHRIKALKPIDLNQGGKKGPDRGYELTQFT